MKTVIRFKDKLSTSQPKMAIDVLNVIMLNNKQKNILDTRLNSMKKGNIKSKAEAHKMFEQCFK